jgi:hypothetical protein
MNLGQKLLRFFADSAEIPSVDGKMPEKFA